MKTFIDQMNSTIRLESIPRRIVSLVPSQTELLHDLGLEDEVVGITKFCIYPDEWFRTKDRVGGTKAVNIEKVKELQPDLIIGNKEENAIDDIEALKEIAPVWMSDIYTLEDALQMIERISEITEKKEVGAKLIAEIKNGFDGLADRAQSGGRAESRPGEQIPKVDLDSARSTVLYYIWQEPNMVSGKRTFVDEMLTKCGLINATTIERYPEIDNCEPNPDFVFLSSEPFPFKEKHIKSFQKRFPESKIVLVDGEIFSWYGSRLKLAPKYFSELISALSVDKDHLA